MAYGIVSSQSTATNEAAAIELDTVDAAVATAGAKQVSLTWADPANAVLGGAVLAKWAGTLVVRKAGSAPQSRTDGTVVVNSTTRDAYASLENAFIDENVTNGTTYYYYSFYPYTTAGGYSEPVTVSATPYFVEVTVPTFSGDSSFTYDTNSHTPGITNPDSDYIDITSDSTLTATDAGTYTITFQLKDTTRQKWKDGTFTEKTLTWYIPAAAGSITLSSYTLNLDVASTTGTVTITQVGDGELSVNNSNSEVVTASISGATLTVSRVSGNPVGNADIVVHASGTANYAPTYTTLSVVCNNYRIMTVYIDESDSNPATCCTYGDDAVDMTPGSDEWDEWFGEYPCLFNAGSEVGKLNTMNFAEFEDGTPADITSGDAGDVMIAFPRHGLNISKTGDVITVTMTDDPDDPNFEYMAHRRGNALKDKFYLGTYEGVEKNSKWVSLSGLNRSGRSYTAIKSFIDAKGIINVDESSGYDMCGFYQVLYIQCMYILKYKNLNSQSVIGKGASNLGSQIATGTLDTKGMTWGTTENSSTGMKLFGMENLWGNAHEFVAGIKSTNSGFSTSTNNFNLNGTGYVLRGTGGYANWLSKAIGTTYLGFMPQNSAGSSTTYYCDQLSFQGDKCPMWGGANDNGDADGIFNFSFYFSSGEVYGNSARLMYL